MTSTVTHSENEFKPNHRAGSTPRRAASAANACLDGIRRAISLGLSSVEIGQRRTVYEVLLSKHHLNGVGGSLGDVS